MKYLSKEKYVKHNASKEWLIANGFRHNPVFSDEESEVYTYRFPVSKYGAFHLLDCELTVMLKTCEVRINVYDCNTGSIYAAFYNREYGDYGSIVNEINERIACVLNALDIRKKQENGSKSKKDKNRSRKTIKKNK